MNWRNNKAKEASRFLTSNVAYLKTQAIAYQAMKTLEAKGLTYEDDPIYKRLHDVVESTRKLYHSDVPKNPYMDAVDQKVAFDQKDAESYTILLDIWYNKYDKQEDINQST